MKDRDRDSNLRKGSAGLNIGGALLTGAGGIFGAFVAVGNGGLSGGSIYLLAAAFAFWFIGKCCTSTLRPCHGIDSGDLLAACSSRRQVLRASKALTAAEPSDPGAANAISTVRGACMVGTFDGRQETDQGRP